MLLKGRNESDELLAMRSLNMRMELTQKEMFHYFYLEKGYDGETKFDLLAKSLQEERYIINDLLLEINNSYCQIDTLVISQQVIYLLDIKNFEGDYYLESDKLYAVATRREYKNPVLQLKRSASLFRQLLQILKFDYQLESFVIHINPEFTLYQAPIDPSVILPSQLNRFFNNLNKTPSKLNDDHTKLAQKLISLHQTNNPFISLPKYSYDQLKKGICCKTCKAFLLNIKNGHFICDSCGEHEKIDLAILRSVNEFKLLFPGSQITTQSIYDWCNVNLSKRTICRVLKKNFTAFGNTRDTYYV